MVDCYMMRFHCAPVFRPSFLCLLSWLLASLSLPSLIPLFFSLSSVTSVTVGVWTSYDGIPRVRMSWSPHQLTRLSRSGMPGVCAGTYVLTYMLIPTWQNQIMYSMIVLVEATCWQKYYCLLNFLTIILWHSYNNHKLFKICFHSQILSGLACFCCYLARHA